MRPIYRLFHSILIFSRLRPLLFADLILNEFKQIGFIALISCLILNVANTSVTSSTQRRMPSINTRYSTYSKLMFKVWTYCTWRPLPNGTPANIRIYLIFPETRMPTSCCWKYGGLRKTILFLQEWRFGRSSLCKVIDFRTNRKRVWDFLLVRHSNLDHILHRFRDIADFCAHEPSLFHPNYGGIPVGPDRRCWDQC